MNENNGPERKFSFSNVFTATWTTFSLIKKKDNKDTNSDLREKNQNHMQTNANLEEGQSAYLFQEAKQIQRLGQESRDPNGGMR